MTPFDQATTDELARLPILSAEEADLFAQEGEILVMKPTVDAQGHWCRAPFILTIQGKSKSDTPVNTGGKGNG